LIDRINNLLIGVETTRKVRERESQMALASERLAPSRQISLTRDFAREASRKAPWASRRRPEGVYKGE